MAITKTESKAEKTTKNEQKKKKFVPAHAWKPGQSGNPNGRPKKGYSVVEAMKQFFNEKEPMKRQQMVHAMYLQVINEGNVHAFKTIVSYLDGLPAQANIESDQIDRLTQHFDGLAERLNKIR